MKVVETQPCLYERSRTLPKSRGVHRRQARWTPKSALYNIFNSISPKTSLESRTWKVEGYSCLSCDMLHVAGVRYHATCISVGQKLKACYMVTNQISKSETSFHQPNKANTKIMILCSTMTVPTRHYICTSDCSRTFEPSFITYFSFLFIQSFQS